MGEIELVGLSKSYRRYSTPWHRLVEWLTLGAATYHREMWALRDVSFRIAPGEAVGVVGANGAGKSTLLKLIAGTAQPTAGTLSVNGRVAALLELGIGFHPDLTGRENALMAGQLIGLTAEEVVASMPDVERFAEIGDAIDQPLRTYSSGMQVRVAFSAATAVRPDVLIVDEALAVGDAYFQHKSFARIREFKRAGTTLLFVSHSPAIVKSICDRALLIDGGLLIRDGPTDTVLDYYHGLVARRTAAYEVAETKGGGVRSGDRRAIVERVEMLREGLPTASARSGEPTRFRAHVRADADLDDLTVGFLIRDAMGIDVYGTNTYHLGARRHRVSKGSLLTCDFDIRSLALGVGNYSLSIALHSDMTHISGNYDWWDRALVFDVLPGRSQHSTGIVALDVECAIGERST